MPVRGPSGASSSLPPMAEATHAVTTVLAAAAFSLVMAYAVLPGQRVWLTAGNGLTDIATAALLALAAAVGWWAIRRSPGRGAWRHLVPLAAVAAFLDEVRFGADLLGFGLPRVGPVVVDGFSSLFAVAQHLAATQLGLGSLDLAAGAALLAACGALLMARRHRAARAAVWLADHPPAVHLLATAVLAVAVVGLELLAASPILAFTEEWLEFVSAAILLRGGMLICGREPRSIGWRQRLRPWLDEDAPLRGRSSVLPRTVRR